MNPGVEALAMSSTSAWWRCSVKLTACSRTREVVEDKRLSIISFGPLQLSCPGRRTRETLISGMVVARFCAFIARVARKVRVGFARSRANPGLNDWSALHQEAILFELFE